MADKTTKAAERQERLAAQLRANLKKRKAQIRGRDAERAEAPDAAHPSDGQDVCAQDLCAQDLAPAKPVR